MFCQNCGKEFSDEEKFCKFCDINKIKENNELKNCEGRLKNYSQKINCVKDKKELEINYQLKSNMEINKSAKIFITFIFMLLLVLCVYNNCKCISIIGEIQKNYFQLGIELNDYILKTILSFIIEIVLIISIFIAIISLQNSIIRNCYSMIEMNKKNKEDNK